MKKLLVTSTIEFALKSAIEKLKGERCNEYKLPSQIY